MKKTLIFFIVILLFSNVTVFANIQEEDFQITLRKDDDISKKEALAVLKLCISLLDGLIPETPDSKIVKKANANNEILILKTEKAKHSLKDNEKYKELIGKIKSDTKDLTRRETIIFINNIITDKVEYAYENNLTGASSSNASNFLVNTAYGALVNGKAVCQGYSNLFALIMEDLKIPSIKIRGHMSTGDYHVWNSVLVDGEWLYVDTTWNDGTKNKHLLTNKDFEKNYRTWNETFEKRIQLLKLLTMEEEDIDE